MEKLTKKQEEIYSFLEDYISKNNFPPSIREIANAVNLSSTATVHAHLKNLVTKNYIKIHPTKNRSIELVNTKPVPDYNPNIISVPLIGNITAGSPIEAIERPDEFMELPQSILPKNKEIFTLNVKGDSMINVGIFDGDIVIIERTNNARNGDIIAAMTDEYEVTLKTFYKESSYIRLQPENDDMEPIIVENVTVLGKLAGLYRKY